MKITKTKLREIIKQSIQEEKEYDKYFRGMLAKYGVESPADLSDEEKSKFFSDVDKGWNSKNEDVISEYDEWRNTRIQAKNIFRMLKQKYNNDISKMKDGLETIFKQNKTKPDQAEVVKQEFNKYFKIKEGNAFGAAVTAAKEKGEDEFEVDGKTYPVKESLNDIKPGDIVSVTRKDGKLFKGKVEKTNPLKIRTSPSDTVVIGNHMIKSVKKESKNEGNAFGAAVTAAKEKGEDEFEVDGKTYPVKESVNEGKFKVDDLVYNKRTKTVGIVRMGDDKYGEVKTDADGNVSVDELEKYNPIKFKHQTKAKVAPSTKKEVNSRGLFNPFKNESVTKSLKEDFIPKVGTIEEMHPNTVKKLLKSGIATVVTESKDFSSIREVIRGIILNERKYDLMFGELGNGITVSNKKETDPRTKDYKFIAHISNNGKIEWKDKDAQRDSSVRREVEKHAKKMNESDCGCGNTSIVEGNAFGAAVTAAKKAGQKEFEFNGKTYKVKKGSYEKNEANKESITESTKPKYTKGQKVNYIPKLSGLNPNKKLEIDSVNYRKGDSLTKAGWYYGFKGMNLGAHENDIKLSESVNESVSVFDERHYGKKGIIIMIDDGGKKVSAIFKDKRNADKYNRNKPEDVKKLLDLAKKTPYPKAIDESVNESATRTAMEIGALTGMNKDFIQKFVDANKLDIEKVFQYVKRGKLKDRMDFVTALSGKPNNPIQKKLITMFKESVTEGKKRFKQQDRVGSSKYTISFHDGKKKHKDGSDFFDIKTFKNKPDLEKFRQDLSKQGYIEESVVENRSRQLVNPETEMLVVKGGNVMTIDKKDWNKYKRQGYGVAESITEGKHDSDLDKVEAAVKNASSFMGVGAELKKAGIKYDFSTSMIPMYRIKVVGNTIGIANKKYVAGAEREVKDIAIGLLEGITGRSLKVENLSPDIAKHMIGIYKGFQKVESDGVMIYDSPKNAEKAAEYLNKKKIAASSDGKYLYIESKG